MRIRRGNLLDAKGVIVHQVNNKGAMGSGVAGQIRRKWPKHYSDYKNAHLRLCVNVHTKVEGGWVVGMVAQDGYGRDGKLYTNYGALRVCLEQVAESYEGDINLPYMIGCGLGGGDWDIVSGIIEDVLGERAVVWRLG
ncbi:MAG: macro domain-containing protein [Candidatus Bathyarchaeota archaeon]|nr:macro domain-containing protein [Candidatus Bathyarchaeota archaeon]